MKNRIIKFRFRIKDLEMGGMFMKILTMEEIIGNKLAQYLTDDYLIHSIDRYIGIEDKNGVEIWEGDILKYRHPTGDELEIIFSEVEYGYYGFLPFTWGKGNEDVVVVGNIYENKELLND